MNLQARENHRRKTVRSSKPQRGGFGFGKALLHMLILGVILFALVTVRISLADQTAKDNRTAARLKSQIHQYERELEHLKLKREALTSWTHVRAKIKQYNLALSAPEPLQVMQVVIDRRSNPADVGGASGQLLASQTWRSGSDTQ
jgi:cell division protein FtsL